MLACGADVVGRTRFCIHPEAQVKAIDVVGGTKDLKIQVLEELKPDLVVLDREENTKEMAGELASASASRPFETIVTHVRSIDDCSRELEAMSELFARKGKSEVASQLRRLAERWNTVSRTPSRVRAPAEWPGVIEWLTPAPERASKICYVIWRNPWMAVTKDTFIASVLEKVGVATSREFVPTSIAARYPEIGDLASLDPVTVLLFSTEPFPFAKKKADLESLTFSKAIVDGESFSWFGSRALEFIERSL